MKVFHRLVGDAPSRGFGDSLVTPGFPLSPAIANQKNARISVGAVASTRPPGDSGRGLTEFHRVFEVQTWRFGQLILIHSASGAIGQARAHAYSDFVYLGNAQECFTDGLTVAHLLEFDDFLPLEWFWALGRDAKSLPSGEWQPTMGPDSVWKAPLPKSFRSSLLLHYWRSASRRFFDGRHEPLSLCLGGFTDSKQIIPEAKALFQGIIVRFLPAAVQNIMSFTAPAPWQQIHQRFSDSALVIVYPESGQAFDFDVQSGQYKPLTADETRMIAAFQSGDPLPALEDLYAGYRRYCNDVSRDCCPLLADYDIAEICFRIHHCLASVEELPSLWLRLHLRLSGLHQLGEVKADNLLSGLEEKLLGRLLAATDLPSIQASELNHLVRRIFCCDQARVILLTELLARQQASRYDPFISSLLPEAIMKAPKENRGRAAPLLEAVLQRGFTGSLPEPRHVALLSQTDFVKLCRDIPPLYHVMEEYTQLLQNQYRDAALLILPLAMAFQDGAQALKNALDLLIRSPLQDLPGKEDRISLNKALQTYMDEAAQQKLDEFLHLALREHLSDPNPVVDFILEINANASGALSRLFEELAGSPDHLRSPLCASQFESLFSCLPPKQSDDSLIAAVESYIAAVSENYTGNAFGWLTSLPAQGPWLSRTFIQGNTLKYIIGRCQRLQILPDEKELSFIRSLRNDASFRQLESQLKDLYESLGETGKNQLEHLIRFFSSTSDKAFLRSFHKDLIRKDFHEKCQSTDFWTAAEEMKQELRKAGLQATVLLERDEKEIVSRCVGKELFGLESILAFEKAIHKASGKNESLRQFWNTHLSEALARQFDALYLGCTDFSGVASLKHLLSHEGLEHALKKCPPYAYRDMELLLKINNRIREYFPGLSREKLFADIRQLLKELQSPHASDQERRVRQHTRQLLRSEHGKLVPPDDRKPGGHAFTLRLGIGLICCGTDEGRIDMKSLLRLMTGWNKKTLQKPYEPKHLQLLSVICAIFEQLNSLDPALADDFRRFLSRDEELARFSFLVRRDKKHRKLCFPWFRDTTVGNLPKALRQWLEEH